jgi:hypothetical protein
MPRNGLLLVAIMITANAATAFAHQVVKREPPMGALKEGQRVLVDDRSCGPGQQSVGWAKARSLRAVPTRTGQRRAALRYSPYSPVRFLTSPPQSGGRSPRATYCLKLLCGQSPARLTNLCFTELK